MEIKKALTIRNRYLLTLLGLLSLVNLSSFLFMVNVNMFRPFHYGRAIYKGSNMLFNGHNSRSQRIFEHQTFSVSPKANRKIITIPANSTPSFTTEQQTSSFLGEAFDILQKTFGNMGMVKRQALKNKRLDSIWNVWNMTYPIDKTNICRKDDGDFTDVLVMIMVVSAPHNVEARNAIRATWGSRFSSMNGNDVSRLVFFVGLPKSEITQRSLQEEDLREGDIVQADFVDQYVNLTLKSVLLLRWVALYCPRAAFVFKVDDDVFVNVDNVVLLLNRNQKLRNTIFGRLAHHWHPIRDNSSYYFVPMNQWTSTIYPDFIAGPAYMITSDAVPKLLHQVSSLPFFFLEDVYITGMCAEKANVVRLNHNGFKPMKKPLNPCIYHTVITIHQHTPDNLRKAWNLMQIYGPNATKCWKQTCVFRWFGICLKFKAVPIDFSKTNATV